MITMAFDYVVPGTVEEAVRLLSEHGDDAKVLAGGHSLIPLMKMRLAAPKLLIDVGRLAGLNYIREEDGAIAIGALTTHYEVASSQLLKDRLPLIPEAARQIGDVQVRNRGTIGGSLSHADPAADLPAAILALEAEMVAQGPAGRRLIAASEFFVDMLTTDLQPNELLVEIRIPISDAGAGSAYLKVPHKASYYAVVGVAAVVAAGKDGVCRDARLGITGLAAKAFRAGKAEQALKGKRLDRGNAETAAQLVTDGVDALSDIYASAEYRAHLARVFTARAVQLAASRASG